MSHTMRALGIRSAEEWSALAWQRPADTDEESIAARREASGQMLAAMSGPGFTPDESFLDDAELLITGRMTHDEHRAYLMEKHKEAV